MYARVAVLTDRGALSQEYTYELPPDMADAVPGACVVVPFQTMVRLGYVVELLETADVSRTRAIIGRYASGDVPPDRVALAHWMAERWFSSVGSCLRMMTPPAMRGRIVRRVTLADGPPKSDPKCGPGALAVLEAVRAGGAVTMESLIRQFGRAAAQNAVSRLRKHGWLRDEFDVAVTGAPRRELLYCVPSAAEAGRWLEENQKRKPRQAAVLRELIGAEAPMSAPELSRTGTNPRPALKSLVVAGVVASADSESARRPRELAAPRSSHDLTADQGRALSEICEAMDARQCREFLLFGVTASGKTEVYLRAISHALEAGRRALVLVPEIALTVHTVAQFRAWFGGGLAVLHSRLSAGERADEWRRIQSGEASVVVGPRSAVFAPLSDLGLIVMDEEHEGAFKQDSDPRYHARDICRRLSQVSTVPLVLGSATPAVETYYRAQAGRSMLLDLPERVDSRPMPEVRVVDMREYAKAGTLTVLSDPLRDELRSTVARKAQAILFLNRRAFGTFVLCRECGYVVNCPHCAVSGKLHRTDNSVRCHHCAWRIPAPATCPECGGVKIASFGVGTQRVEQELAEVIPDARILRMDRDTTSGKDSLVTILEAFRSHEADVLIGTQMVAKGLDFPGVLLVGVVNADTGLHMPDFRAAERGFQLLTQVAGRAGRGQMPGRVLLQTFQPEHYAIQAAAEHDFRRFYEAELPAREELSWPPFASLARILVQCAELTECQQLAEATASSLRAHASEVEVLGPSPAPIERLKGRYRWHMVLRAAKRSDVLSLLAASGARQWRTEITVDLDPVSLI